MVATELLSKYLVITSVDYVSIVVKCWSIWAHVLLERFGFRPNFLGSIYGLSQYLSF